MARASLAPLIARIRTLTGATVADFDDDAVEAILDANGTDAVRLRLTPTTQDGLTYDRFAAPVGDWEDGAAFSDAARAAVTPGEDDAWNAATGVLRCDPARSSSALYLTGRTYDTYGAAADLLDAWSARTATAFDASVDGNTYNRSSMTAELRNAARAMRRRARVAVNAPARSDERWA